MNKTLLAFLLALTFIWATVANATPRHDSHGHYDRHRGHHGNHYKPKHYYGHGHYAKYKRHHRHEAGYFLGGLFIGTLLADGYHHDTHYIRRQHRYSGPVYYRDEYGSCFRVEQRRRGEVLIEVPGSKCAVGTRY